MTDLRLFAEVDSTNDALRRLADDGAPEGTVVIAETQSLGRGRQGRRWHSPPGVGLYISVLVRDVGPLDRATRWTLGAAVAVCEACNEVASIAATIKWPNDVQVRGRKLAGILAELRGAERPELVVGCGINALHRAEDFPEDLRPHATSLRQAAGSTDVDREGLAAAFLARFAGVRQQLRSGGWDAVARRWAGLAPGAMDQPVRVHVGDRVFEGRTAGLDPLGGLVVRSLDGATTVVRQVDSVRPLEAGVAELGEGC